MRSLPYALFLSFLLVPGCDDDAGDGDGGGSADAAPPAADAAPADASGPPTVFGGARPATLLVPASYDPATPAPLVVALHGYATNTAYVPEVFGLAPLQESEGFLLISPAGTADSTDNHFWNATEACCNFEASTVDDVAYLNGLIDEITAAYNVDPKRIYLVGHSNGGFMSYRFACESAGRVAAVLSVAGATFDTAADCDPASPVSVLQIHGTSDETIIYAGGEIGGDPYPSAAGTRQRWAAYDGCAAGTTAGAALDLTGDALTETDVLTSDGCPTGISVELWTVAMAPHLIFFKNGAALWAWLEAHPKP